MDSIIVEMDNVVKTTSDFVAKLLNESLSPKYSYHNLAHTQEVFDGVTELGINSNLPDNDLEIVQVAALFHDTGFTKGYIDHENKSIEIMKKFLYSFNYPEDKIFRVSEIIIMTDMENNPVNLSQKIIRDADILHIGKEDFYSKSLSLKSEWESVNHKKYSDSEWIQSSLDFINRTFFYTDYAKLKYEPRRQSNIHVLEKMIKAH
jgi:predicted metal-dependent HD superfamily phosphohydrolase